GDTLGLELRGGTLCGVRIAAATLNPPRGTDRMLARISGGVSGAVAAGTTTLDVESLGPLDVSPYSELREAADPADFPVRALAPVVFNGRIDAPGDTDRFVLATTPAARLRIKVEASELGSALDGVLQLLDSKG